LGAGKRGGCNGRSKSQRRAGANEGGSIHGLRWCGCVCVGGGGGGGPVNAPMGGKGGRVERGSRRKDLVGRSLGGEEGGGG